MLNALLPRSNSGEYRGSKFALWILAAVLLVKLATAGAAIFNGHYAASQADGIPIESFTPAGANTIVALFGTLGATQALLSCFGLLLIWRYQALVPAFISLLVLEFLVRKAVTLAHPIARVAGNAGTYVNWAIFALLVLALALSLRNKA